MLNMQALTGGAEAARDVPGAIVGEHAPDADAVVAKSAERPPEKAGDGGAVIIGSELDVCDPRVIVDGDVQQIPTDAVVAIDIARPPGDAVAEPRDPTQLLCVQVQQVPGPRMFIAVHQRRGAQAAPRDRPARRKIRAAVAALTPPRRRSAHTEGLALRRRRRRRHRSAVARVGPSPHAAP